MTSPASDASAASSARAWAAVVSPRSRTASSSALRRDDRMPQMAIALTASSTASNTAAAGTARVGEAASDEGFQATNAS